MPILRAFMMFVGALMLCTLPASASDLTGEWVGVSSGNHVMMEMRNGGFSVVFTGQQQAGQISEPMFYRDAGSGTYIHTFDNGTNSTTQILGPDKFRVTNSDGWTDVFQRTQAANVGSADAETVPTSRAFDDAAAAAAAATAQPGPFDKYADDALSVRSSADVARDQAASVFMSAEERALENQHPVPHCSDSDDRAGYAQCLKVRNEAIFKRAEAEMALLDRDRPSITSALYESHKVRFEQEANLARNSCAKLANTASPCDLSGGSNLSPNLPSRVIARDGRRALDCVKMEQLAQSSSSTSGGGTVLANQCSDTVTIGWCSTGGECERGSGNITNVLAGRSWPVDANHEVRWGACHGANTLHGDPGSKGLQFTCSAPDSGG